MRQVGIFLYNSMAYLVFLGVTVYGVCFLGNIWIVPSMDANPQMPLVPALLIDGSLVFLFVLWRGARNNPGFKRYWNRFVHESIERPTHLLIGSMVAAFILWEWQPIGRVVWEVGNATANLALRSIYLAGWMVILFSFLVNQHRNILGLKQWWINYRNTSYRKSSVKSFFIHKLLRSPFFLGMLICLWSAPTMTVSHLFLAMLMTLYVITIFQLDEKNLTINYREKFPESIRRR